MNPFKYHDSKSYAAAMAAVWVAIAAVWLVIAAQGRPFWLAAPVAAGGGVVAALWAATTVARSKETR